MKDSTPSLLILRSASSDEVSAFPIMAVKPVMAVNPDKGNDWLGLLPFPKIRCVACVRLRHPACPITLALQPRLLL